MNVHCNYPGDHGFIFPEQTAEEPGGWRKPAEPVRRISGAQHLFHALIDKSSTRVYNKGCIVILPGASNFNQKRLKLSEIVRYGKKRI